MAGDEAQGILLAAQMEALRRQGATQKQWITMEDERVRPTHVKCGSQGPVALDGKFSNGLRFPGDPQGPASETCNCRCWLEGVWA